MKEMLVVIFSLYLISHLIAIAYHHKKLIDCKNLDFFSSATIRKIDSHDINSYQAKSQI